jgi:hypothetical protein
MFGGQGVVMLTLNPLECFEEENPAFRSGWFEEHAVQATDLHQWPLASRDLCFVRYSRDPE